MLMPELASEKAWRSCTKWEGKGMGLESVEASLTNHQESSLGISLTDMYRVKGCGLHKPSMDSKAVK